MIVQKVFNAETKRKELENKTYLDDRIGFWGRVVYVDAQSLTCSVLSDTGTEHQNIPVATKEWVCENENFISAERNLPPLNSIVFVFMPTHTMSGAFILCSGYTRGDENLHTLFAPDYDKETLTTVREKKTCSGWSLTEDYESGNLKAKSHNEEIQIEINPNENFEKNEGKQIQIKAWNTEIQITQKGVFISTKGDSLYKVEGEADFTIEGNLSATVNKNCNVLCEGDFSGEITGKTNIKTESDIEIKTEGKTKIETKDDIEIKSEGKLNLENKGDTTIKTEGNATIEVSGNCDLKASQTTITGNTKVTGGMFECGGTVAPSGQGALCGIPNCCFTGAPQVGNISQGT